MSNATGPSDRSDRKERNRRAQPGERLGLERPSRDELARADAPLGPGVAPSRSRGEVIAKALREEILRGIRPPGSRLPAERELALELGASRSSVREAFQRLEQLNLIEIRRGEGARVRPIEEASLEVVGHLLRLDPQPDLDLVAQLLDVHEALVTAALRLAVVHASGAEVARARELLRELVDPGLGDREYYDTTFELVQLISVASRNLVLRLVRNAFQSTFQGPSGRHRVRLRPPRAVVAPIADEIVAALDARDPAAAEAGVRRLMRANRELFLKRLEARAATSRALEGEVSVSKSTKRNPPDSGGSTE